MCLTEHVFYIYAFDMPQGRHHGTEPRARPHGGRRGPRGPRCRFRVGPGRWEVHARVERFVEPALLLVLREGETHGYDLAEALAELAPDDEVDLGNLYRLLRSLELEGLVVSRWRDDLPGRAKRTYALTEEGRALLDSWAEALGRAGGTIAGFLARYGTDTNPTKGPAE
jgi:DNA-binding PadR family transcriptional regulator